MIMMGLSKNSSPKKTTDDCYTPPLVYEAVSEWVSSQYGLDKNKFFSPVLSRAETTKTKITPTRLLSIILRFRFCQKIVKWYISQNVRFSCLLLPYQPPSHGFPTYAPRSLLAQISPYENGAVISTSFCTNLEPHEIRMKTAPSLYAAGQKKPTTRTASNQLKHYPKYCYPPQLITSAQIYPFNKYGN